MARGRGLQAVQLDDEVEPSDPSTPAPARRRLWWIAVPVVLVILALVAHDAVTGARERAAIARLRDVPGVLAPVDPGLPVRWEVRGTSAEAVVNPLVVDGALLGAVVDRDGTQRYVAIDEETGERRWDVELLGPDQRRADELLLDGVSSASCVALEPPGTGADQVACLVSDGFFRYRDGGLAPATTTFVRVLDTRDGTVVAQWPAVEGSAIAGLHGRVVVARRTDDGGTEVVAHDPQGRVVWTRELPPSGDDPQTEASINAAGDLLVVGFSNDLVVLDAQGVPLAEQPPRGEGGGWVWENPVTGSIVDAVYDAQGRASLVVLRRDGSLGHTFAGEELGVSVDDGSVPNLRLMLSHDAQGDVALGARSSMGGVVQAWDESTGEKLWSVDVSTLGYGAAVLRGRVYVATPTGLVALDGRTGSEIWRAESSDILLRAGGVTSGIMTDGQYLLTQVSTGTENELVARAFADGREVWRTPLPDGLDDVYVSGTSLVSVERGKSGASTRAVRIG